MDLYAQKETQMYILGILILHSVPTGLEFVFWNCWEVWVLSSSVVASQELATLSDTRCNINKVARL